MCEMRRRRLCIEQPLCLRGRLLDLCFHDRGMPRRRKETNERGRRQRGGSESTYMCVCRSVGRVCAHHRTRSVRMEQRKYSRVWAVDLRFHDSDMTRRRTKTATDRESRRRTSDEHDAEHGRKCRKMRLSGPKMGLFGTPLADEVFGAQFSVVRII